MARTQTRMRRLVTGWRWRTRHGFGVRTAGRAALPFVLALAINGALFAAMVILGVVNLPRGLPEEDGFVTVFVVPPLPDMLEPEEEDETPEPEEEKDLPPEEIPPEELIPEAAPSPTPDPENAPAESEERDPEPTAPPQPAPEPEPAPVALPDVALPEVDPAGGDPDGIVALSCYDLFQDRRDAAECAGTRPRAGWQVEIENLGEEWEQIAEELRRGGAPVPGYGPDRWSDLGDNETIYRREDPRFRDNRFFDRGKYEAAFDTPLEARRARQMRDPQRYISINEPAFADHGTPPSEPLSGWRPSWMLRDDPNLSDADIRDFEYLGTSTDPEE